MRLDKLLTEKGLTKSRQRAQALITEGKILVDGKVISKASKDISDEAKIEIVGEDIKWVSRAGLKLEKALEHWKIDVRDFVCLDIGASTGGFTDVLLSNNISKVYAVDVGHGQLDEKIKNDPHVINIEKTNARELSDKIIPEKVDFVCIDVSFISLELILPEAKRFLKEGGQIIALIKPQFEVGKKNLGKSGVVKDPKLHQFQ